MTPKAQTLLTLILALTLLALAACSPAAAPATAGPTPTATEAPLLQTGQWPSISSGSPVSLVGQVLAIQGSVLMLDVLQGPDQRQPVGLRLQAEDANKAQIAQGTDADIRPGAVARFDGVKTGNGGFRTDRITILK